MSDALSLWQVVTLAILQGVAEFLPISSSGHLLLMAPLLLGRREPPEDMLTLSVVLHIGTLGSIVVHYRAAIRRMLTEDRRVVGLIVVGTLPAVVVGLAVKIYFEDFLEAPWLAAAMLLVTGTVLWVVHHRGLGTADYRNLSWLGAFWVGVCQAAAILPGLSRSGATIAAGLAVGLSRPAAATYAFLLALPALAGAGVLEGLSAVHQRPQTPWEWLLLGALVAFAVGLAALRWLERWLVRGRLVWFAWYCWLVGAVGLLWQLR
jgi:undecaprenyl-diphosphatase